MTSHGFLRTLAAFAVVAVLGLASPSAHASITLSYGASDTGTGQTTSGSGTNSLSVGPAQFGNFSVSLQTSTNDPSGGATSNPGYSNIKTTTIAVRNTGSSTDTLTVIVSGQNFTAGPNDVVGFSISGTTSGAFSGADQTSGQSFYSTSNTAYGGSPLSPGTGTKIDGTITSTGITSNGVGGTYQFPNNGNSTTTTFTNSGLFSLTQLLTLTLGASDGAQITITTQANGSAPAAVPEPSTMAIAALGTLGFVGYGLRRRKARAA
jgi:hypothetical protein